MTAISGYPTKTYPGSSDYVLIADGADSNNYKKVNAKNLALNPVLTKSAMSLLPTVVGGCIVRQRDVSSTDTAYNGTFYWDSSNQSANVTRDPAGGCYVPPATDLTGASGCWVRAYSKDAISPEWFGNNRSDVTFQLCMDFLNDGDGVVIEPGSTWTFSTSVLVDQSDIKIFSQSYPMAVPVIQAGVADVSYGNLKGLLLVRGTRCAIHGIAFWGTTGEFNNGGNEWGTSIGINFDGSSVVDAEAQSNIDARVTSCSFQALHTGIRICGRNVKISQNTFTFGRYGIVGVIHTYTGNGVTQQSAFRGHEIIDNRFHSTGAKRVYLYDTVTHTCCIKFPNEQAIILTGGPAFSDNLIHQNHADWSVGLYEGAIHSTSIMGNHLTRSSGPIVYCDMSGYSTQENAYSAATISHNILHGRADEIATPYYYTCRWGIYLNNVANVTIKNNTMSQIGIDGIVIAGNSYWCSIEDNVIIEPNSSYPELGNGAGIVIAKVISTTRIKGNTILGNHHAWGIYIVDGAEYVFCDHNQIDVPRTIAGRTGYNYEIFAEEMQARDWGIPAFVGFNCDNGAASPDWDYNGTYVIFPGANYPGPRRCQIYGVTEFPNGRFKMPSNAPTSSGAAGEYGMFAWDDSYVYVCVDTNTWKRIALSTF